MKITNKRIIQVFNTLDKILEEDYDSPGFSLKGAANKRKLEPIAIEVSREKQRIQENYADYDEEGRLAYEDAQKMRKAQDKLNEIDEKEREVNLETFSKDELPDRLTGNQISGIFELIEMSNNGQKEQS